jgi:phosphoribosylaminoimidazole-succinocarboxamide synthase
MSASAKVYHSEIPGLRLFHRGKVRDVYEVDSERLLLVATDRLSAFDCVLPTAIERKGSVLTALSAFWFERLRNILPNHLIAANFEEMPSEVSDRSELRGRSMLVHRTKVFPVECVVRGYLEGSGWKDYLSSGSVCGHQLPVGLQQCAKLPEPLFTPATKAMEAHDENIPETKFAEIVGEEAARILKAASLEIYREASEYALTRGIIIADTKFEFGLAPDGRILLIDEVLTPDSSRFWDADRYESGRAQASFDKQFVREYLESIEWDKRPPAPALPPSVAAATTARYVEAYRLLTGKDLA